MLTYQPGNNRFLSTAVTAETVIVFYSILIAFAVCLLLSHRSYIKQTPLPSFKDVLAISVLFLFITYCITYAAGYLEYLFFYKKQYAAQHNTGLMGLLDALSNPGAQPPAFEPLQQLFWYPVKNAWALMQQGRLWYCLHEIIISKVGMIVLVIYYEALYLLFKKYGQQKWFYILPVINKWKLVQIAQRPVSYFFVLLIPFIRVIVLYIIHLTIAGHFKKNTLFALGMTLLAPFYYGALAFNNEKPDTATEQ